MLSYSTCGDPRKQIWAECDLSPNDAVLSLAFISDKASVMSIVLQATGPVIKSVPFKVRAQLAAEDPE